MERGPGLHRDGAAEPRPMNEDEFQEAVRSLITDAEAYVDANWRPAREDGWERYRGMVDAKPEPGGEDLVHCEVRDALQQIMPEVMEQLAGGDEPIEYYSHDPSKVDACRKATLMALSVWWEGGGWIGLHDAVMHAGVGRVGALKVFRHERLCQEEAEVEGLPEQVDEYAAQPGYTLIDREDLEAEALDAFGQPVRYVERTKARVRRYYVETELRIEAPHPGEIICTATSDPDQALCIGQRSTIRMADLRSMGIELEELEGIEGYDSSPSDERAAEVGEVREAWKDHGSWALKPVTLYEVYCLLDADGDGLLERWKVIAAGDDVTVLRAEQRDSVDDQPYVLFPFRRSPQTIQGLAAPDLVGDLQESKTKLTRDLIDNTKSVSNPMFFASGPVNWTQLQQWRRHKVVNEGVAGAVRTFAPPPIAGEVLPVLQHLDSIAERRLGVGRTAQGLQTDQLTSVAAVAVAGAQAAAQRQSLYTVRTIAELGLRPAFQKLLRLMVTEKKPRAVIGMSGQYELVDPKILDPTFGVRCRIGLGAMSMEERKAAYRELIGMTAQLLGAPGAYSQITSPSKAAALLQAAAGEFKGLGAARFFASPEEMQKIEQQAAQQPPPPDPKMIEAQGRLKLQEQKLQGDMQMQGAKLQGERQVQGAKLQSDRALQAAKVEGDAAGKADAAWRKQQTDLAKILADERTDRLEIAIEAGLEQQAIKRGHRGGAGNANIPRQHR